MKRILTAIAGVPATVLLTLYAPKWLFGLAVAVVGAACLEELLALGSKRLGARPGRGVLLLGAGVTASFIYGGNFVLPALTLAVLLAASAVAFGVALEEALPKAGMAMLGLVYCSVLPGFLILLRPQQVIVLIGLVWIGDAAAFYGGRSLGRHLLAPSISPKKTVEGAFAGLIASVLAGVLLGVWISKGTSGRLLAASLAAACAGQIGDLVESALKRSAGVKDSSSLLPGHGGMLDRLDSLLFAAPVYYWLLNP